MCTVNGPRSTEPELGEGIERRTLTARAFYECPLGQASATELLERRLRFLEPAEPHPLEHPGRLRELDLAVVDDLEEVPPGSSDGERRRRRDRESGGDGGRADGLLVVDHDP